MSILHSLFHSNEMSMRAHWTMRITAWCLCALLILYILFCGGCSDMITGAERTISFANAEGKVIALIHYSGDDMKAKRMTLEAPDGYKFAVSGMEDTDQVGGYQAQAFMAGIQLSSQMLSVIAAKLGTQSAPVELKPVTPRAPTPAPAAPLPKPTPPAVPAAPSVQLVPDR